MARANHVQKIIFEMIKNLSSNKKRFTWITLDFIVFIIGIFSMRLIFRNFIYHTRAYSIIYLIVSFLLYLLLSSLLHLNTRMNRYMSILDIFFLFITVITSDILASFVNYIIFDTVSFSSVIVYSLLTGLGIIGLRFIWQSFYTSCTYGNSSNKNDDRDNIILIGAGDGGSLFINSFKRQGNNSNIVAIIDVDPAKKGSNIAGVNVVGGIEKLPQLIKAYKISKAVIAIPSLLPERYEAILKICNDYHIKVFNMPPVEDVLLGVHSQKNQMREINIADLLGRKEIELDESVIQKELEGKTILITGAGGSIGSEIVRQVSKYHPNTIVLLGHGENSIYLIYHEIIEKYPHINYVPMIADVQDYERILAVFKKYQPNIVYHAAAHKHVPLMESNPMEAIKNNVYGTYNVAKAVDQTGVPKMVMISTDKAVRPTNVMGATKRIAELILFAMNQQSKSNYCSVRFGNVLGSRGSVVPVFKKQIDAGGPITVTDFRMIRYFMTIPEASRLVIYAGTFAEGGEVFILDMGDPVKIIDLAKKLILLSGYSVDEIGIVESGIRPGEKLYEELLTDSEEIDRQVNEKIFVGKVMTIPIEEVLDFVSDLTTQDYTDQQIKDKAIKYANDSAL